MAPLVSDDVAFGLCHPGWSHPLELYVDHSRSRLRPARPDANGLILFSFERSGLPRLRYGLPSFRRPAPRRQPRDSVGGCAGAPVRTLKTAEWQRSSFGQDNKGHWRMPWRQESMKDVAGCDKPR